MKKLKGKKVQIQKVLAMPNESPTSTEGDAEEVINADAAFIVRCEQVILNVTNDVT